MKDRGFSARIERDASLGEIAVLAWDGAGSASRATESSPALEARFSVGSRAVIDFDPSLLRAHDFTGTPVLYPTPNRVRDCRFAWKGREYAQRRSGRDIYEHGLAHLESWGHEPPTAGTDGARFVALLDCRPESPMFEAFPFPHRLGLSFTLTARGIRMEYAIENCGAAVMEATPDLLPTGRLADVAGTALDLRYAVAVGTLDLDHVFTRVEPGWHAAGEGFFCLENQTCSTDAHNLSARGFADVSGLKTVEPGAVRRGSVCYAVSASSAPTVPKSRPDARLSRIPGIMTGPRLLWALPGTRGTPSRRARRPRPPA